MNHEPEISTSVTVEVLTAEVRQLMVGKRQVTISMARQLDQVDLEEMEPWGRIRLPEGVRVVGRRKETGALVRAEILFWTDDPGPVPVKVDDLTRSIAACRRVYYESSPRGHVIQYEDEDYLFKPGTLTPRNCRCSFPNEQCSWELWPHEVGLFALAKRHKATAKMHYVASTLPLLVLAGLH